MGIKFEEELIVANKMFWVNLEEFKNEVFLYKVFDSKNATYFGQDVCLEQTG